MSSASAYSLEIPSVRQWKAKISFPYAAPQDLSLVSKALALFLLSNYQRGIHLIKLAGKQLSLL
ncbi:hypothetical protein [Alteribacillus sp. YIM 98480]|uniref:hypothetical protein n=1 Tax=Alteribacillus sp. YIM 98480 TaxID=2606599 RepID=UPI00131E565F|nr:hypothetical protein [Alteribacillus sp. YIM 98480]